MAGFVFQVPQTSNLPLATLVKNDSRMQGWLKNNHASSAAIAVLALTNIESFSLLSSNLFHKEAFSAPFSEKMRHQLMIGGLIGNVLEDVPQLIIQSVAASSNLDTITLLSIVASILTISTGLLKHLIVFSVTRLQGGAASPGYRKQLDDEGERDWGLTTAYSNMDSKAKGPAHSAEEWDNSEVVAWLREQNLPSVAAVAKRKGWDGAALLSFLRD